MKAGNIAYVISLLLTFQLCIGCGTTAEKEADTKEATGEVKQVGEEKVVTSDVREEASTPPTGGVKAEDFNLLDIEGKKFSLSDYSGKVIILDFWATWCPPCVKEIPHFNELAKEYGDRGLVVLGISLDREGVRAVKEFRKKYPIDYRVVMGNNEVARAYSLYLPPEQRGGIPFTFVIDREGMIRHSFVGYRPKKVFVEVVEPLL